jgi:hypothetical protein
MEEDMRDTGRRPVGRHCCLIALAVAAWGLWLPAAKAGSPQSGPATTTVTDTVYLADGTPAQGTMFISWPAFQTASGSPVVGGTTELTLATNGTFSVTLVPNGGATPAGVYYTVVYSLGPGQVKTEYWVVPTTSPANLAAVVATPGSGVAGQPVSMQYVNSELATKANDNAVVHLANAETITGTKTFSAAPNVPTPTSSGQVASKGYVDEAVSNVGSGVYLPTAGGTMTGPITLPSNPSAPMQAATKSYVDTGMAAKADLISGLVPTNELGTGSASGSTCLLGNGTWGACAAGGSGNLSTNPTSSQTIAQPAGTQFATNNLANIRYVTTSWNWAQTPADNLSTAGNVTIHLSPCPLGIDTASGTNNYLYKVYISGQGTPETPLVTGGTCTPGATSGTITLTTANSHAAGYTVGSASSGLQEAWNDAWVSDGCAAASSCTSPYVKLMADTNYYVYAAVYLRGRGGMLDGAGALIVCSTRDRCIYVGSPPLGVGYHKLYNLTGGSTLNVDGAQVTSVAATSGAYTITTASNHPFVVGDMAACEYHSQTADQRWVAQVTSVPNATTFTVSFGSVSFAAGANTFGFCNILNTFIEDASEHVAVQDINVTQTNPSTLGFFSYGLTNDNDQQLNIERAANRGTATIKNTGNWPMGAFFYQRTDQGNAGIMYVHDTELTNVNCADGGGNGFVMTDTVCQGFPVYGIRYYGGYQPSTYENLYEESTGGTGNPLYAGGLASQMGLLVQGGLGAKIVGTFPVAGWTPTFASGGAVTTQRNYFVIPRSSTQGYGPMWFIGSALPSSGSVNINLQWPSIELEDGYFHSTLGTLTWDILVTTGTTTTPPYGSGSFALATNVSGSCTTAGMCSYTDTQAAAGSYVVQPQAFTPEFWFWPSNMAVNNSVVFVDVAPTAPGVVATQGTGGAAMIAAQCTSGGGTSERSPVIVSCETITNAYHATLWPNLNGTPAGSKGRFNLGPYQNAPNDFITLYDSNFSKTIATAGERPSADAGDTALGADQPGGLSQRAATSITSYIDVMPNGTNFLERLTASGKTFNVPLTASSGLAVTGGSVTLPVTGSEAQCLHVSAAGVLSGTGADCGSGGGGGSGTVNAGSTSQLAFYSGNGAAVSGDSTLSDNGTTLNYSGTGGIAAAAGTFSGNVTVNGQLLVAGPWTVSSPTPGTAMGAAGAGMSSLGISNDGNFYISANGGTPQKVATSATSSYFSNLFQEDANDLGMYNGTTPQNLHVYSSYTGPSTWQRTSVGFDVTDNLAVLRSENSTPGNAPGIGFWIGSSARWEIDSTSTLKPLLTNSVNVGAPTFALQTVYAGTSFDTLTQGRLNFEMCNDGTTGTSLNFLAVYNVANPSCAVKATTANTDGVIGVVSNGSGTSGNAVITYRGYVPCSFDGSTTAGDFVVASTSNAGDCHDAGATRPTEVQVLGRVESTNSGIGTYGVRMSLDAPLPGTYLDAAMQPGTTLDAKLNYANAMAITNGGAAIDARALGGAQTIASEVSIGELRPPTVTAVSGTSPGAGTYKIAYTLTSPTQTETSASMESTVTVTGSQAIQVASPAYYGTATSYNVYVTPVGMAGAGTVNTSGATVTWASGQQFATGTSWSGQSIIINGAKFTISSVSSATSLTLTMATANQSGVSYSAGNWGELKCAAATNVAIGTNATISSACSGAAVSKANNGYGVSLIPPHAGVWTVTIADSVPNTSCGLRFFDQSSFLGDGAGEGRPWYLTSTSSTNVEALACTDNNPKNGGGYYSIRGLAAHGTSGDSIQTAACVIFGPFDVSVFDDIQCMTNQSYPAAVVYAWGTGASTRISGSFEASSVGQPLVVGVPYAAVGNIDLHDISAVHPGNSYPNIAIVASVQAPIHFSGTTYMEGPGSGSCVSPIQIATQNNISGPIIFDSVHHGANCSGTSAYLISVPSTYFANDITVGPVYTGSFTNLFNYGPNTGLNISSVGAGETHPGFTLDLNNPKVVLTNFQVLGTTTLAAAALGSTSTATTQNADNNSTKLATTAYVDGTYLPTWLANSPSIVTGTGVQFYQTNTSHAKIWVLITEHPVLTSNLGVWVQAADSTGADTYDIGIYQGVSSATNNLLLHTGAVTATSYFSSTGYVSIPWASTGSTGYCSTPCVLPPGRYYVVMFANEASSALELAAIGATNFTPYYLNGFSVTTSGGALPNTLTSVADSPQGIQTAWLALH